MPITTKNFRWMPWIICGLAALFYCYEYYLRIAPSVMTADLMRTYQIQATALGAMVAFYYHAYTPMQIPVGMLMDRFGPRRLLTFACLICAVGTYLFAATNSLIMASVARLMIGFGSAFAFIGVLKLAHAWLPANRFAMVSGLTSMLGVLGALSGNITMTSMVGLLGWQNTTWLSGAAGVVLAIIIFLLIRDRDPTRLYTAPEEISDVKKVFRQLVALLANYRMWAIGIIGCLLYLPTSSFAELWGFVYFRQAYGFTPTEAAYAVSTIFVGWGLASPFTGWLSDKMGKRCLPMVWGGLLGAALITILVYVPGIPKIAVYPMLFLFGACYSVEVIVFAYACDIAPSYASGTALAITNMLVMLGGSLFQPLIGFLLDFHAKNPTVINGEPIYAVGDFQFALQALPIGLLLAALMAWRLHEPSTAKIQPIETAVS